MSALISRCRFFCEQIFWLHLISLKNVKKSYMSILNRALFDLINDQIFTVNINGDFWGVEAPWKLLILSRRVQKDRLRFREREMWRRTNEFLYSPTTCADRRNRATLVALLTVNGRLGRWQDKDISILEQDKDISDLRTQNKAFFKNEHKYSSRRRNS